MSLNHQDTKSQSDCGIGNLQIVGLPGAVSVAWMRPLFESIIAGTPLFEKLLPLQWDETKKGYANPEHDILWIGFALGLRMAERIEKAGGKVDNHQKINPSPSRPSQTSETSREIPQ